MKKRLLSMALGTMMVLSTLAGCGSKDGGSAAVNTKPEEQGKVLNIYCWNEEFKSRFEGYYKNVPSDVKVNWVITPNENNAYQNALDAALLKQKDAAADDKIDMFLIEADYALKYVNSDYTLDVKDVGLTDDDLKDMYQYTKDIATDSKGKLKATTWQATPVFSNNVSAPWVDSNNKIVIDDNIMKWVDQTKKYTDKGYNNKSSLWDSTWAADQGPSGKVFGFFYSTWGINFTLLGNSLATPVKEGGKEEVGNGIYGDYAVCEGPQSYYWGGTWICAAAGTDNANLVKDVMKTLCCDKTTMKKITEDTQDYTNTTSGMNEIANSDFKSAFLGGQNHIKLFAKSAPKISMKNISSYDQGLNEEFQKAMKDYFDGNVTKDKALDNFYKAAIEKYPNLSK